MLISLYLTVSTYNVIKMSDESDREWMVMMHRGTKSKLDALKLVSMESYENVVLRLIESYHKHHKAKDPSADIAIAAEAPKQEA